MVVTTWSAADEFIRAEAETQIWAGGSPRTTLVLFEGEVTTLIASAPVEHLSPMSAVVELATFARVLGPERFVLASPLPPVDDGETEFTVSAIAARPVLMVARASRGRRRERIRAEALPYGRDDHGSPVWRKSRRLHLRRGRTLRRLLVDALNGKARGTLPDPVVIAAYLLDGGHEIVAADGWAERYGLGDLTAH